MSILEGVSSQIWVLIILVGALYLNLLIAAIRDIRKNKQGVPNKSEWEKLEMELPSISLKDVPGTHYHPLIKRVLSQILSKEHGQGYLSRIPLASQPLERAIEGMVRVYKEWASFFIMVALLVSTGVLAFTFTQFNDSNVLDAKTIISHFRWVFPINALVLLTAVGFHYRHLHAKTLGDCHLRQAYETLGVIKEIHLDDVDPNLAAALEQISGRFETWSESAENRSVQRIDDLVNVMQTLSDTIGSLFKEVLKPEDKNAVDENLQLALQNIGSNMETLYSRLDQTTATIIKAINDGLPATEAMKTAAEDMTKQTKRFLDMEIGRNTQDILHELKSQTEQGPKLTQELSKTIMTSQGNLGAIIKDSAEETGKTLIDIKTELIMALIQSRDLATEELKNILKKLSSLDRTTESILTNLNNKKASGSDAGSLDEMAEQTLRLEASISKMNEAINTLAKGIAKGSNPIPSQNRDSKSWWKFGRK